MPLRAAFLWIAAACWAIAAPQSDYLSAKRKLDAIQRQRLPPGSSVTFTPREIDAWSRVEIPKEIPRGFREPHVQLGEGTASGRALVDFLQMRQAQGQTSGWLMSRMLEGERPLLMSVRLRSSGGWCTVDLTRVEISGVAAQGSVLDFLIRTFFLPLYPNAKIGEPFELGFNMERLEIHPSGVVVRIGNRRKVVGRAPWPGAGRPRPASWEEAGRGAGCGRGRPPHTRNKQARLALLRSEVTGGFILEGKAGR